MFYRIVYIVIGYLFLISGNAFSQQESKYFRNISVDRGLSQSTVFTIIQDTLGFIWMGTQDGLNRYNSKDFKVYRPERTDENSLQSYSVRSLFIDHKGHLWVGGNQGISCYDYITDSFKNYKLPRGIGEWYISAIVEDAQHNIWASSTTGDIFRLSPSDSEFSSINFNAPAYNIKKVVYLSIWQESLLLGTEIGLFRITIAENKLTKIDLGIEKPYINDVYIDSTWLWIATEGNGLLRYNIRTSQVTSFVQIPGENSVVDNNIRCIGRDMEGNMWLGTFRGLSIFDPLNYTFDNYLHQISQPYTISQNSVRCIYRDRQNGMWLGTYYGGISYYHKNDIKFNLLSQNTGQISLNDEVVSTIMQDEKGDFWIGTNDQGLNYWNRSNNSVSYYKHDKDNINSLSSNNIKGIAFDDDGNVLVGAYNSGLNVLDPLTGKVQRYKHDVNDPNSIAGDLVYSILKDRKGRIWIGTRSGLDQFHSKSKSFTHIYLDKAGKRLNSNDITYLFEDSKHRIWIGTTNGVSQFYPDNSLFGNIDDSQLSEDVVNCIAEDKKNRIWIGTRGGLSLYDEDKRSFITFKNRKDFIKGAIYGIMPDEEGNLWISTNEGLVRFNPDTQSIQVFSELDGLQNNQFNEYAFCTAKDGMMLFGGIRGISYFYPSEVRQERLSLALNFTGLKVFNDEVLSDDATHIFTGHIDQTKILKFAPEYTQFSILFNTFNYISANRTFYYYKLEGVDDDWQRTDDLKVSYSNLSSGSYEFFIKAVGPNGENSSIRSLKVVILPPWYKTIWFYSLVFLFIGVAAYISYRIIFERIKVKQQLKLERLEKEKMRYINQEKTDFFTNVSHELRTPLTLILAPLEELVNKPFLDKGVGKQLELMFTNAKRLYSLVEQLFEFKKTEQGILRLKVEKGDIVSFVNGIYESFKPLSEKNNILYTYHSLPEKLSFYFDKDALEKILFNLLSNAFKYTNPGQKVSIELLTSDDFAIIKIADTGVGISKEEVSKVFDRFYQVNNGKMNLGSGVGLAFTKSLVELHHGRITLESELGQGSVFTLVIPMGDAFYTNDLHIPTIINTNSNELSIIQEDKLLGNNNVALLDSGFSKDVDLSIDEEVNLDKITRLLLVDDNKDILSYLDDYFSQTYHVTVAYDGKMALEILESQQFDLIISDVMMPELDGLHFCKRIKQNINTSHIPFILLTAKSEVTQQINGLEMGADEYVTKPFSINLLSAKVVNLLRSRKRLREYYSANKEIIPENIAFNKFDEEFLKEAIAIIESNLSDSDFSVDKFSKQIGISRSSLYLKLKAITGESVIDLIKRIRFNKAIELMQSKQYTIAQIAYMCGFNSPSYFTTAFKQYYNCIPSEYLAKLEEGKTEL